MHFVESLLHFCFFADEEEEPTPPPPPLEENEPSSVQYTSLTEDVYRVRWQKPNIPLRYYKVVYTKTSNPGDKQQVNKNLKGAFQFIRCCNCIETAKQSCLLEN